MITEKCLKHNENGESVKEVIKETVMNAVDPIYNLGDIEKIKEYYHPGYVLMMVKENDLEYKFLFNRIELRKKKHELGEYPPPEKIRVHFCSIIVVGTSATVHFQYFVGKKHTCDDFMSLCQFKEGWKIVSQTTYHHPDH